jgi:phosphonate transport system permease protein
MSASTFDARAASRSWRPPPLISSPWLRYSIYVLALAYTVISISTVEVNWTRAAEGLERAGRFLGGFFPPDFVSKRSDIIEGLLESLTMTVVSTALGIALSIPVALGASRNLAPLPIYLVCRAIIAVSRTFQEIIIAIVFVAKLIAEDIEDIEASQAEAVRATGASWFQLLAWGVLPQVKPRLIGLSAYRLDINFRESAVLGLVGAGGIGDTLNTSFDRYEFDTAAAVLIVIILIVLGCEYASGWIRRKVQ